MRLATGATYLNAGIVALALVLGSCAERARLAAAPVVGAPPARVPATPPDAGAGDALQPARYDQIGIASWYGRGEQGRRTASGARFDRRALTAAHPSLPLGTIVLVENLANGQSVALRITDRGPYRRGRIIDLSQAAARRLGLEGQGLGVVGLTVVPPAASTQITSGH
jgi:rare lipoprotein A